MTRYLSGAMVLLAVATIGCGRPDDAIAADVRSRVASDQALHDASISVVVKKGVVLLRGQVAAANQTPHVTAAVAQVAGVRRVITQLTLRDQSIREAVMAAFRRDAMLAAVPIEADVSDGVVRLTSSATNSAQRSRAVAVARGVTGVVHVDDYMK